MSLLGSLFRVRPGEGRNVGLIVALMFTSVAGLTIGESGISALFFDRVGADALPQIYLAQGVVGLVAMLVLTGSLGGVERSRAYVPLLLVIAALVLVERTVIATGSEWIYPVLWLTVAVAMLVQAIVTWGTAGLVTDTRRAKRLFPLFSAGGILGAVAGGLVTRPLAQSIGAENLLIVWAATLAGAAALCGAALRARPRPHRRIARVRRRRGSARRELRDGFAFVRRSPLLVWMTAAAVLFSILFFSLYLPFAKAAAERFPDADDLAGFLGVFWAVATGAAFFISVLLTNRLLGWLGAASMIVVLPILYAGSFGILLATSSLTTLVAARLAVSVWMQGVASPAWETMVNVVPEDRRDQTRAFLNGGPTQVGTAIAGLVQLVGQRALSADQLALFGLGAAAITILVTWRIRRSYVGALVDALRAGRPSVFDGDAIAGSPIVLESEVQALALALEAAHDPDPRVRRLAVEMLSDTRDGRGVNVMVGALDDPDAMVRVNALRGLQRQDGTEHVAKFERALNDQHAAVRLAAVAALRTVEPGTISESMGPVIDDADAAVAAAASVALLHGSDRAKAMARLRSMLSDDDQEVRITAIKQLRLVPSEDIVNLAGPLGTDASPAVRAAALQALASAGPRAALEPAVLALDAEEPSVRAAAIETLFAVDIEAHRGKLEALARTRSSLAVEDHTLESAVPVDDEASRLLRDAVGDRGRRHALVALSLLALLSEDREALRSAIDSLDAVDPGQVANALETVEAVAGMSLVRPLLGLWETTAGTPTTPVSDWLERALTDPDPFIRACGELVRTTRQQGDDMARSRPSMSPMERVIALRRVPLFAELSPTDLSRIARIAEECSYADGDMIAVQGEIGDELHIVVGGAVKVVRDDAGAKETIARRETGDVVGEMSIITRGPRVASLVADGQVRTVRIGGREFESMIRERPEVSLAVMRVLAERLSVETAGHRTADLL